MHLLFVIKREHPQLDDSIDFTPTIPEKKLLKAMLERTILDIFAKTKEPKLKENKRNAIKWVFSPLIDDFSYLWTCDILEIDPNILRRFLVKNKEI